MTKTPRKPIVHAKTGKLVAESGVETTPAAQRVVNRAPITPAALKVAELKAELQARGLSPAGLKKDLVERLEEAIKNEDAAPEVVQGAEEMVQEEQGKIEEQVNAVEHVDEKTEKQQIKPQEEEKANVVTEKAVEEPETHDAESKPAEPVTAHSHRNEVKELVDYEAEEKAPEKRSAEEEEGEVREAKVAKVESNILHIIGFVRPLMVKSVQELLAQYGAVEDFWMDSIKSHCYVRYGSNEATARCKEALDGQVWPKETGKALSVTASTTEEMEAARASDRKLGPDDLFLKTAFEPSVYYLPATGKPN